MTTKNITKTVYIDNSSLFYRTDYRGIQRVRRKIIENLNSASKESEIKAVSIVLLRGRYWEVPNDLNEQNLYPTFYLFIYRCGDNFFKLINNFFNPPNNKSETVTTKVDGLQDKSVLVYIDNSIKFIIDSLEFILDSLFYVYLILIKKIKWLNTSQFKDQVLIIPDSWRINQKTKKLKVLKKIGLTVIPIVHDILPITHPKFFSHSHRRKFIKKFNLNYEVADGFITVSKTIQKELFQYLKLNNNHHLPIDFSYLGSDISHNDDFDYKKVRSELLKFKNHQNIFIIVGALDTRKGHMTAINAFTKHWESGGSHQLIIIGAVDFFQGSEIEEAILNNPFFNKFLHFHSDIDDNELTFFYKEASALIFPSQAEGFGLPLVEAMEKKLPIIASDIEVFREIAKDWPEYFQTLNEQELTHHIDNFSISIWENKKHTQWINWHESTKNLLKKAVLIQKQSQLNCQNH